MLKFFERPSALRLYLLAGVFSLNLVSNLSSTPAQAQDPPPSADIFLVSLDIDGESVQFGAPVNVTQRSGYDNQPHFLPDGKSFVYTSIGDDGQADIWAYDLAEKVKRPLIETAETSEYSPTPIPDENALSVIRVEADGETQRLWRFPLDGGEPDLLLPDIKPVGYHVWLDAKNLAFFVLGEPHMLQAAKRGSGDGKILAHDIGRALHRVPGSFVASFVHKEGDDSWYIKKIDPTSGEMSKLVKTRPGREDFTWLPNGLLLMGDGGALYVARANSEGWKKVADFESAGLSDISRLAVHPDGTWLALVAVPVVAVPAE